METASTISLDAGRETEAYRTVYAVLDGEGARRVEFSTLHARPELVCGGPARIADRCKSRYGQSGL